jgi:biopolymer transport protein ExbD
MSAHVNFADDDGTVTGINVTPMVDIMLVLLIVFMVTASFISESVIKINVPKVADTETNTTVSLAVSINEKGELYLKNAKQLDAGGLKDGLIREVAYNPNVHVTLAADSKLPYQRVVEVLDIIKQAGIAHVALISQK